MLTICCLGSRALNSGVPFRSEKSVSQVQHRTNRMSSDFPIQRVNLTFPRPRRPESGHLELTQHRSETSTGIAPSRPTARGPRTSAPSFRTHQTAKTLNYSRSRSLQPTPRLTASPNHVQYCCTTHDRRHVFPPAGEFEELLRSSRRGSGADSRAA